MKEHVLIVRFGLNESAGEISAVERFLSSIRFHVGAELNENFNIDVLRAVAVAFLANDHLNAQNFARFVLENERTCSTMPYFLHSSRISSSSVSSTSAAVTMFLQTASHLTVHPGCRTHLRTITVLCSRFISLRMSILR